MLGALIRRFRSTPECSALFSLALVILLFACLNHRLVSLVSLSSLFRAISFVGLIVVGQALLVVAGELDLSVGAVASLSAIVGAWLLSSQGWPVLATVGVVLVVGGLIGLINGILAVVVGVPAFIATLGMCYIARGCVYLISQGYPIYPLPVSLTSFGKATPCGLSWSFFSFVAIAAIADVVLRRTVFGRWLYATGGNRAAAHLCGIDTRKAQISCYVITGILSSLAGVLLMAQLGVGQPEIGTGWELETIASVVIGGVSLHGGIGTVASAVLGLVLIQFVRSGLVLSGVDTHWQPVAIGAIMIFAVVIDQLRHRTYVRRC